MRNVPTTRGINGMSGHYSENTILREALDGGGANKSFVGSKTIMNPQLQF